MHRVLHGIAFAILLFPAAAAAQPRVPAAGSSAVGGDVGLFVARADNLGSGPAVEGFFENYLDARTSVRIGIGWANPSFDRGPAESMRHIRVGGDLVYNLERGAVHPFVGAGVGMHVLQARAGGGNVGDSRTQLGGMLFGGAEFFTARTTAVKAEARYHVVRRANGFNPDGLSLMIGLKQYF
jgi:hypothetical protein